MPKKPSRAFKVPPKEPEILLAISKISLNGFKSICGPEPQEIRIAPLTVLAGANSSGKSSVMQPLLLLKQTLEASYDPGPLLLHGPLVRLTSTRQISPVGMPVMEFSIGLELSDASVATLYFRAADDQQLKLIKMETFGTLGRVTLSEEMTSAEIETELPELTRLYRQVFEVWGGKKTLAFHVARERCFLMITGTSGGAPTELGRRPSEPFAHALREVIHLAGLRGNPERSYGVSAPRSRMPGSFESYVAGVILDWQHSADPRIVALDEALMRLGLTWKIEAQQLDATAVELKVGRLPRNTNGGRDLVNIADVGFGLSQALPIVVALLKAKPGQLVYIEQPEIHLHPKAQEAMAGLLVEAANWGVRVVVETHSSTILIALQTLIASGRLKPENAVFHWFARDAKGMTRITSVTPDENGAYGDWPEDFSTTQLDADQKYIEAVEAKVFPQKP
jgi:hypothetical protein